MSLVDTIRKDMFLASKEGDSNRSDILKMVLSSVKNVEITKGEALEDSDVEKILRKETKKIQDSISQYSEMGRKDLVDTEKSQLDVLNKYLPDLMSDEEVEKVVKAKIEELGATSKRDMGRVMGIVMKELDGKADGGIVKRYVDQLLS
jgi:uncharacterized protein YqeY